MSCNVGRCSDLLERVHCSLIFGQIFKNGVRMCYKSVQIQRLWKQNGPKKASFTLKSTPHIETTPSCNGTPYINIGFSPNLILRVYISADMKPRLIIKQNNCEVSFNSIYPLKMQVHKIQVCFTICLIESVSHSYIVLIHMHQFCCISWP